MAALGRDPAGSTDGARQTVVDALAAAGAMVTGTLPGWVDELLRTVARPALRIAVETLAVDRPLVDQMWATPADAVTGETVGAGTTELSWVDPTLIPHVIAQRVRLRRRVPPATRASVQLRSSQLVQVQAALAGAADRPVGDGSSPNGQIEAVARIVRNRRVSWRATAEWADPAQRRRNGSVSVIDAGETGLWMVTADNPDDDDPLLRLEAVAAGTVWTRLVELLPTDWSDQHQEGRA